MDSRSGDNTRPVTQGMQIMLLAASVLVFLIGIPLGGEIDWGAPGGWVYVLFLLSIGLVGLTGLRRLR